MGQVPFLTYRQLPDCSIPFLLTMRSLTMRPFLTGFALILTCSLGGLLAAHAVTAAGAGAKPAASKLSDLDWMAGTWRGTGFDGKVDEVWSQPAGDSMLGFFRLVSRDETMLYRFLAIEQTKEAVELKFKNFRTGYEPLEKDAPLRFKLTLASPEEAVFTNVDPKQAPSALHYKKLEHSAMSLSVENPPGIGGAQFFEVLYEREAAER